MDRAEAYELASRELGLIESGGYGAAAEHIDTAAQKVVSVSSGNSYDVEISYHWKEARHEHILVICTVTSKSWFAHEKLEESLTLYEAAN
jgi:hypothetical protein